MTDSTEIGEAVASALAALLRRDSIQAQVEGIEALSEAVRDAVVRAVDAMLRAEPDVEFLLFERLGRLGDLPVERLVERLPETVGVKRTLAAAALVALGSDAGLADVLDALQPDNPYACVASRVLTPDHADQAVSVLEAALARSEPGSDVAYCFETALERLRT